MSNSSDYNCSQYYKTVMEEERFSAPMPWVGLYAAAASLICSLAMAVDAFLGCRNKKLWFPCRFFTLNAATLTLLAVAMKLPVDLSSPMPGDIDQLSKLSSIIFLCTVMGNFMPCLGQMSNKDIVMNLTALGILVITIFGNLCIQLGTGVLYTKFTIKTIQYGPLVHYEIIVVIFLMPVLLVMVCFSALSIPSTKKYIDLKYSEINKKVSSEGGSNETNRLEFDILKEYVRYNSIMAETGSPQFVIGHSVTCCVLGAICILTALILVEAEFRIYIRTCYSHGGVFNPFVPLNGQYSNYKWSTCAILVIQTTGVGIGTIAPAIRWLSDIKMKCSGKRGKIFTFHESVIEKYWTEKLEEWRENPLPFEIRSPKFKKLVHITRNLFLSFCIWVQIVIVVASKSIQLLFVSPIALCKWVLRGFISTCTVSSNPTGLELAYSNLNGYVLLLEGEKELPERMLKNIRDDADLLIQEGIKKQPKDLMKLLMKKSVGFKRLAEFDSKQVSSLSPYEPPNCWKLPLVTLTRLAISLPDITSQMVTDLQSSVSEGLVYVSLVEKVLDAKGDLINSRKAAKVIWLENELYGKWLGIDLRKIAHEGKNLKSTLQMLSDLAKERFTKLSRNTNESVKENPVKWPIKVVAANSMYRICQTLLLSNIENTEEMFEKLSVMISDIMSACLTNLPRVITMKCVSSAIEKRDESVQHAARVLGETEEILNFLQHCTPPSLDPDQAAYIDNWIQFIQDSQV